MDSGHNLETQLYFKNNDGEYKKVGTSIECVDIKNNDIQPIKTPMQQMSEGINLFAEGLANLIHQISNVFINAWDEVSKVLNPINASLDKKMKKKRFMKLLQSYGIQRNEIKKIVANNKTPYTYRRLLETINLYKGESQ